jgi:gamma-D-glutamyl-L-lysine dipeptidyl-peptidase
MGKDIIDYGVCRLAIVPVYKDSSGSSEQITQLLFGDHYHVHSVSPDKKLLHITIFSDRTEGWIDAKQHHSITPEYFEQINQADFKITMDIASGILYKKSPLTIVMGSIVPISNSELFKMEEQLAFNGEAKSLGQRRDFEFLKSIALKYVNAPCHLGGKSPFGIDAPGLVQMIFKIVGYALPRDMTHQNLVGKNYTSIGEALPGDLAFFQNKKGEINHVGIVLEEEKIIHASGRVRIDYLHEEGIIDAETKIYTHHLSGFRRILL